MNVQNMKEVTWSFPLDYRDRGLHLASCHLMPAKGAGYPKKIGLDNKERDEKTHKVPQLYPYLSSLNFPSHSLKDRKSP